MNDKMTEAELRMFINYHHLNQMVGKHHRLVTDSIYELTTALQALRKGRVHVTEERLELVLEYLNKLMSLTPGND